MECASVTGSSALKAGAVVELIGAPVDGQGAAGARVDSPARAFDLQAGAA